MMILHYFIFSLLLGSFPGGGDIDADFQGNIYVLDKGTRVLTKFSPQGDKLAEVRDYVVDERSYRFDEPSAVVARSGIDVWVADMRNHRVLRFDRTLELVGSLYTQDDPDERRRFGLPRDLAVTRQGDLLVVDGENARVLRFDPLGRVVRSFGGATSGKGHLTYPVNVEVDDKDNAYVLDNGSILRYDPFGSFTGRLKLPIDGQITTFTIDGDTLVVCDSSLALVYSLNPLQNVDAIECENTPLKIRRLAGAYYMVEQKRAGRVIVKEHE